MLQSRSLRLHRAGPAFASATWTQRCRRSSTLQRCDQHLQRLHCASQGEKQCAYVNLAPYLSDSASSPTSTGAPCTGHSWTHNLHRSRFSSLSVCCIAVNTDGMFQPSAPRFKLYKISGDGSCLFRSIVQGASIVSTGEPCARQASAPALPMQEVYTTDASAILYSVMLACPCFVTSQQSTGIPPHDNSSLDQAVQ
jgi:hypothetical protein